MPKFLRLFAVLLFAATTAYAISGLEPAPPPMCYDLPMCTFSGGTWHYSHQCTQGAFIMYVYENQVGDWCLGGPEMP